MSQLEDLQNYIKITDAVRQQAHTKPDDWAYGSYEAYVLDKGVSFSEYGQALNRGKPQQCFRNAFQLAWRWPHRYSYVEGWATHTFPTHHAWVLGRDGQITDTTWGHRTESAYFGVVFTREEIATWATHCQHGFSMLYPSTNSHPLLETGEPL